MTAEALKASVVSPGKLEELYTVGAQLGAGGYASVKRGTVKATGAPVAIKIFDPRLSLTDEKLAVKLLFEVVALRAVGRLGHPNLAGFLAAHEDTLPDGRPRFFIVTPLYSGGELFDRIVARGHYTEADAATLFASIAHAVGTLHAAGIWHRDLKPENILMASPAADAPAIVCDYGFARLPDYPDLQADVRIGTYAYMAPEIWISKSYSAAVDVFALGVLLYIMLVGFPPFWVEDERDRAGLQDQIVNGRFSFDDPAWDAVSGAAKALVAGMLEVEPSGRLTMEDVLHHSWFTRFAPDAVAPLAELPPLTAVAPNLRRFNATRKLRAAARVVAWGGMHAHALAALRAAVGERTFSPEQMRAMRAAFNRAAGRECALDLPAFRAAMTELGCGELPLDRMFHIFDRDSSGTCDFRELLVGFAAMQNESSDAALRVAFDIYDTDGSGFLTLDELFRVLVSADLSSTGAAADAADAAGGSAAAAAGTAAAGAGAAGAGAAAPPSRLRGGGDGSKTTGDYGLSDAREALAYRLTLLFADIDRVHNGKGACASAALFARPTCHPVQPRATPHTPVPPCAVSFEEFREAVHREPLLADVIFRNTRDVGKAAPPAAAASGGGAGGGAS